MGSFKKAFKKVIRFATGGSRNSGQSVTEEVAPAPELGFVKEDPSTTTESESEKQQLTKGKKRGKKSLKVNMTGAGGAGRNIV